MLREAFNEIWETACKSSPLSDQSEEAKKAGFRNWMAGVAWVYREIADQPGPREAFDLLMVMMEEINEIREELNIPVNRN
jgi:hypothetical protein